MQAPLMIVMEEHMLASFMLNITAVMEYAEELLALTRWLAFKAMALEAAAMSLVRMQGLILAIAELAIPNNGNLKVFEDIRVLRVFITFLDPF